MSRRSLSEKTRTVKITGQYFYFYFSNRNETATIFMKAVAVHQNSKLSFVELRNNDF